MKKKLQQLIAGLITCLFLCSAFSFTTKQAEVNSAQKANDAFAWYEGTFTNTSNSNGITVTVRVEYNPATSVSRIADIRYGYGSGFFTPGAHSGSVFVNANNDLEVSGFSVSFSGDGVSDSVNFSGVLDPVI
ncbi:MAG: hypothetical protein ABW007_02710 [Chitinophagaceae bacterium]